MVDRRDHVKKVLRLLVGVAAVLFLKAPRAHAQSTAQMIDSAVALYTKFDIEGSRPLLQKILSSSWLQPVSDSQRVQAYKYLGATFAVLGKKDSAATFFAGALSRDAFTDLDPTAFGASEIEAFNLAKKQLYRVGMRPMLSQVIDPKSPNPDSSTYRIHITTTQSSDVTLTISLKSASRDSALSEEIFRGTNDGTRDVTWRGTLNNKLAPPGTYELVITGTVIGGTPATDRQQFIIEHVFETLEDTLPRLGAADTLISSYGKREPLMDLLKGAGLGIAAFSIPVVALDKTSIASTDLGSWNRQWQMAAAIGIGSGLMAMRYRGQHLEKPDAVKENLNRQTKRLQFNQGVAARNRDRLDKTKLIICPIGAIC